jgi:hypothetical protein
LKPEYHDFLRRHVPGYDASRWTAELAASAGSQRQFWRIGDGRGSLILMVWNSRDPDWARCLGIHRAVIDRVGLIPRLLASDPVLGTILEEDLGSLTLHRCWEQELDMVALYRQVLVELGRWQRVPCAGHPVLGKRVMDAAHLAWESRYFSDHCVAGLCGRPDLLTAAWEAERLALAARVDAQPKVWMHRDFQSENVMWSRGRIRFVDYQGARLGPAAYDVASLVFDPYLNESQASQLAGLPADYLAAAPIAVSEADFLGCAAQRLMQALGAYGKLSRVDGLTRYESSVPLALARLATVAGGMKELPCLRRIVAECLAASNFTAAALSESTCRPPTTASRETAR